jgi:outer membrane protein assembly factor BamB
VNDYISTNFILNIILDDKRNKSMHWKNALLITLIVVLRSPFVYGQNDMNNNKESIVIDSVNYDIIIPTFLGDDQRNYYGNTAPDTLQVIWKHYLGKGKTIISRKLGEREWAGAGWTGQPLLVEENGHPYLIQGAYDHKLKKIDALNGKIVWEYAFDDVVKGTGTLVYLPNEPKESQLIILQGSRLGVGNYLDTKHIPSYRAISYLTGKELWRFDQKWTHSYSRDVDGSALFVNDTVYIGFENSLFTSFNASPQKAKMLNGMLQPETYQELKLYHMDDVKKHRSNVVTESSPSRIGRNIYVASGSGNVWGYNMDTKVLDWNFYIGSDIDGSAVVTGDSCIMVSVEKQYIDGLGGIFKLKPGSKEAVQWYFPAKDKGYASWEGGVIGSVAVNDRYVDTTATKMAAFVALDGYLYVVQHDSLENDSLVQGPRLKHSYNTPKLVYKYKVGASISTPVFTNNKLVVAGYGGIYLFNYGDNKFRLINKVNTTFESTPILHNGRVYIASRDGNLYCLGRR